MFMIATQKYNCLINADTICKCYVYGNRLIACFTNQRENVKTETLGEFRTYREAQDVLSMMCAAYAAGDDTFKIPEQEELEFARQHSSTFVGMSKRRER